MKTLILSCLLSLSLLVPSPALDPNTTNAHALMVRLANALAIDISSIGTEPNFTNGFRILEALALAAEAGEIGGGLLAGDVDVAGQATGGAGTVGDPWTGWDTAITWTEFTRYNFRKGYFSYATSPNFAKKGIQLVGSAGTIFKHTGTGVGFNMDAGAGAVWIQNVLVENIIVLGNANTTDAFYLRGIRNGEFNNLSVRGCSEAGIRTLACVTNVLRNFRCTHHEPDQGGTFAVTPKSGIVTEGRGTDWSTTWTIINPVIEGVSEEGIWFKSDSYGHTIINGTSEGNTHASKASVRVTGRYNQIFNLDSEANTSGLDFLVDGSNNELRGITSTGTVEVSGGTCILGPGQYNNVTVSGYLDLLEFANIGGTFTDNGTSTRYMNVQGTDARSALGAILPKPVVVTITASNLATDAAAGNFFIANGTENYTLTNPTNAGTGAKAYQSITWKIVQDAGRTVAFGSEWRFMTRNISSSDLITFLASYTGTWYFTATRNSADSKWDITDVFIDGLQNKLLGNTTNTGRMLVGAGDSTNMALGMNEAGTGFYRVGSGNIGVCGSLVRLHENGINFGGDLIINWYTGGAFAAVSSSLCRKADSVLGLYDAGANTAQTFRIYGDATKYLSLGHDGTNAVLSSSSGNFGISGNVALDKTITAGGTTGAQTISKTTGSVNFAAAATSLVVTNTLCTANSVIICTVGTNDATMKSAAAVAGSGSFTIYASAAPTAETKVFFLLTN